MKRFGLIGFPLNISFSKQYFSEKFERNQLNDHVYELFPLADISTFRELIQTTPDLCGLNVTMPHKKTIIPYLDNLHESASSVGAVNVIKFETDGRLTGYNSDISGFEQSFLPLIKPHHHSALILGTGGSSGAVAAVLQKHHIPFQWVSRRKTPETWTYQDIHQNGFGLANIIINTTPLGMTPNTDTFADLPYKMMTPNFLCYDLVYTPNETLFLQKSKAQGATIKNGLEMLHLQAERAWEIWTIN